MNWNDIKERKSNIVHGVFGLPAVYTSPAGVETACTVRKHPEMKLFGDLEDEGYAQRQQNVNVLVVDTREIATPERKGIILFADGDSFRIVNVLDKDGYMQPVEVAVNA